MSEVEELRAWQREVCDQFGYDSTEPGNAEEVLTYLPYWRGEAAGYSEALAAAEARLRKVEALADEWERHSLILLSAGTGVSMIAHADAVQRIRAVLAAEPAEPEPECPMTEDGRHTDGGIDPDWNEQICGACGDDVPAEVTPPAEQRHPSLCICPDCDAAYAAKRAEGGAS
jgi:hypothetical protein